jgi:CRP-like cAMP-binding protein
MTDEFVNYLNKHSSLPVELIQKLIDSNVVETYKKGTILLREGDRANECYLILKGCIRSYVIKDGEEKTIEFYTEEQSVTPPSYGLPIPSELNLECIEDTVACTGTPEREAEVYGKHPELVAESRIMAEKMLADHLTSYADYKTATAEERYLKLQKERPDLIQRVPQYQLASYLGVQPESLSRIRKRLVQKHS